MATSQKKIEANRRNAQRSTGPRTAAGKNIVKRNAITHGLLAKHTVLLDGDGAEDRAAFQRLLADLWDCLQPVGRLEELLVEQIAEVHWRRFRLRRHEIGEIQSRLATARADELLRQAAMVRIAIEALPLPQARLDLQTSAAGVRYLLRVLEELEQEVATAHGLGEAARERVARHFGPDSAVVAAAQAAPTESAAAVEEGNKAPDQEAETPHRRLVQAIADEKYRLEQLLEVVARQEQLRTDAMLACYALPTPEAANLILRYGTAHNRNIYRAINQLERLQRQRRGEVVPPAGAGRVADLRKEILRNKANNSRDGNKLVAITAGTRLAGDERDPCGLAPLQDAIQRTLLSLGARTRGSRSGPADQGIAYALLKMSVAAPTREQPHLLLAAARVLTSGQGAGDKAGEVSQPPSLYLEFAEPRAAGEAPPGSGMTCGSTAPPLRPRAQAAFGHSNKVGLQPPTLFIEGIPHDEWLKKFGVEFATPIATGEKSS